MDRQPGKVLNFLAKPNKNCITSYLITQGTRGNQTFFDFYPDRSASSTLSLTAQSQRSMQKRFETNGRKW